ncbi:MAG: ABC transporter permease [Promethearchaeota archaeon]|jgi:iron(III) transport system permease protein
MVVKKDDVVQYLTFIITAILILTPISLIIVQGFLDRAIYDPDRKFTFGNYILLLTDTRFHKAFRTSFFFAAETVLIAVILGALLAILTVRTNVPFKGALSNLTTLSMFISPLVGATGWIMMFGPAGWFSFYVKKVIGFVPWNIYTLQGMGVVAGLNFVPYAYLSCTSSLQRMDPNLEDTARIAGAKPLRTFLTVTLPLLRPAMLYSAIIILVIGLGLLGLPLILGQPYGVEVIMAYLYRLGLVRGGTAGEYGYLAAQSMIMIIITSILLFLQRRVMGSEERFVTIGGRAVRPRVIDLGRYKYPMFAIFVVYISLAAVLPIVGVAMRSITSVWNPDIGILTKLTTIHYEWIFNFPVHNRSITNTMTIALIGATLGTLLVGVITVIVHRSNFKLRKSLLYLSMYPRAIPSFIMGLGFLWLFVFFKPVAWIRNTIFALVIVFVARRIPYGIINISPAALQISSELDKSSRVCGATWLQTLRFVVFPLIKPGLVGAWVLLFAAMIREYSSALMVFTRGTEVIGITMLEFWRQGHIGPVCALGVIQVVIVFTAMIILQRVIKIVEV